MADDHFHGGHFHGDHFHRDRSNGDHDHGGHSDGGGRHDGRAPTREPADPAAAGADLVGWLDLSSGASGDMLLGALVDAGVPLEVPQRAIDTLGLPIRLRAGRVRRGGIAATKVDVEILGPEAEPAAGAGAGPRRTWADIRGLIDAAPLAPSVRAAALATFARLAEAEGRVHGIPADDVHFHEVGGLDAIADVVGVCAGLDALGLRRVVASTIALGGGSARTEHGRLPVPGPAVLELLRAAGAPVVGGPVELELCTPTGAALVATAVSGTAGGGRGGGAAGGYGPLPAVRVTAVGHGAGGRDIPGQPNIVRLVIGVPADRPSTGASAGTAAVSAVPAVSAGAAGSVGSAVPAGSAVAAVPSVPPVSAVSSEIGTGIPATPPDPVAEPASAARTDLTADVTTEILLETNVDDADPRTWPEVLAALLAAGAADAWLTPMQMKKGRPAHTLSVLVRPSAVAAVREAVFRHTPTLGVRETPVRKHALARLFRTVDVDGQPVRVKVGLLASGEECTAQPEWEDVRLAAERLGLPARAVLARAAAMALNGPR